MPVVATVAAVIRLVGVGLKISLMLFSVAILRLVRVVVSILVQQVDQISKHKLRLISKMQFLVAIRR